MIWRGAIAPHVPSQTDRPEHSTEQAAARFGVVAIVWDLDGIDVDRHRLESGCKQSHANNADVECGVSVPRKR